MNMHSQFHGEKKFNSITVAAFTKIRTAFLRRSIILLLILCRARCIAAPWGSGLMKAFNKMLLHTWNILVISGRRQRGRQRNAAALVPGKRTGYAKLLVLKVRHCTRSPATCRPKQNVGKLSGTANSTTRHTGVLSTGSIGENLAKSTISCFLKDFHTTVVSYGSTKTPATSNPVLCLGCLRISVLRGGSDHWNWRENSFTQVHTKNRRVLSTQSAFRKLHIDCTHTQTLMGRLKALWLRCGEIFIRNAYTCRPVHCRYILHIKITSFQNSSQQIWLVLLHSYTKAFITISSDKKHRLETQIISGHAVFVMPVPLCSSPP